jgi:hypothetical protein
MVLNIGAQRTADSILLLDIKEDVIETVRLCNASREELASCLGEFRSFVREYGAYYGYFISVGYDVYPLPVVEIRIEIKGEDTYIRDEFLVRY